MHVRVPTPHGLLDRELDIREGELTLPGLARAVMPLAGDMETLAARQGERVSCAKGCGACCRQLVTVSPAEAWMIAELIGGFPAPQREAVETRLDAVRKPLEQAGLLTDLAGLADPALSDAAHYDLARRYFELGLACPFQDDDGACGIYLERPALCREYLVSSPPVLCSIPFSSTPRRLPVAGEVSQALLTLSAQLLRREVEPIPLALAAEWARAHSAAGRKAWDSGRLLERFLLHLEVSIGQQTT